MKSTILLATALFLASAPSPDSKSISEISAGFLSADDSQNLMAAEVAIKGEIGLEAANSIADEPDEASMEDADQTDNGQTTLLQNQQAAKDQR